jgi:hypothetical protein
LLGGGGVLSAARRAGMLEKVRRAKGDRRCWMRATRRRDMMGVWEMTGGCIRGGDVGVLLKKVREEEAVGSLRLDSIRDWDLTGLGGCNHYVVLATLCSLRTPEYHHHVVCRFAASWASRPVRSTLLTRDTRDRSLHVASGQ